MKSFYSLLILLTIFSCKSEKQTEALTADIIINKSIAISGGEAFANSKVSFDFRDRKYLANRSQGQFVLARMTVEENNDSIFDLLSNDGFERFINDKTVIVSDSMIAKYTASVNSVHYFSVLPFGLNDKAVIKTLLGEEFIKDKNYYKIKVTFSKNGGGEDFEDEFVYWVNTLNYKVGYVAYSYAEEDGIGLRFREAYNERTVNGLRFVDYYNYKPESDIKSLLKLSELFQTNKLKLLSKIELKSIVVDLINN